MSESQERLKAPWRFEAQKAGLSPVAIFQDRYGGQYSGGPWVAVANWDRPERQREYAAADGNDFDAAGFWQHHPVWAAPGDSPISALSQLLRQARKDAERREAMRKLAPLAEAMMTGFIPVEPGDPRGVEPPLGLTPFAIHRALRIQEITAAMERYTAANMLIPPPWRAELRDLLLAAHAEAEAEPVSRDPVIR